LLNEYGFNELKMCWWRWTKIGGSGDGRRCKEEDDGACTGVIP